MSEPPPSVISPEIDATLEAANSVSDEADGTYERKVFELRQNAVRNAGLLRKALERLPANAHGPRQMLLSLLGDIASQPTDAQVLELFAKRAMRVPTRSVTREQDGDTEGDNVTTWQAMFALARCGDRAATTAEPSIQAVLQAADRQVAFTLGVELQEHQRFSAAHRRILERRGINPHYEKPDAPERLLVDAVGVRGAAQALIEPPKHEQ
jgi:hypothetical protein